MASELLCPAICFRDLPESCFPYKTGPTIETAQNLGNLNERNIWSRVSTIKHVCVCTSTGHPLPAELGVPPKGTPRLQWGSASAGEDSCPGACFSSASPTLALPGSSCLSTPEANWDGGSWGSWCWTGTWRLDCRQRAACAGPRPGMPARETLAS